MNPIPDYMSLWEISHRWHDGIPLEDERSVTREIRDTLIVLLGAVMNSRIALYEETVGWPVEVSPKRDPSVFVESVEELPAEFEEMFLTGIYDRKLLAYYRVSLSGVFWWAVNSGFSFPDFLIPAEAFMKEGPPTIQAKPRPEAEDKARCQEISQRKWKQNPLTRIAEMARDQEVRRQGNGGLYEEPTLLRWLREVAPEGVKGRPGRPRKVLDTDK